MFRFSANNITSRLIQEYKRAPASEKKSRMHATVEHLYWSNIFVQYE